MALSIQTRLPRALTAYAKRANRHKKKVLVATLALTFLCNLALYSPTTSHVLYRGWRTLTRGLSRLITQPPQNKMLIYVCMKEQGCAGWSDRQKSMVGMFLLALVTNRTFGILLKTPCDISNFYMPNKYNWIVDEWEVEERDPRLIYPANNLNTIDFNQQYPDDVLYGRVNSDIFGKIRANPHFKPLLPAWAKKSYKEYFHAGWTTLMKPVPKVQQRVDKILDSLGYSQRSQPLVGIHMRMGRNPSNPKERHHFYDVSQLGPVWQKVEPFVKNGSQLFVASDSQEVRNVSREMFGKSHHDTEGIIMHVGKQRHDGRACQGLEDLIVDQLMLSYCDILVVSRGGFALRASWMGWRVQKMFTFTPQGKVVP